MRKAIGAILIGGSLVIGGVYAGMRIEQGRPLPSLPQSVREKLGINHQPAQVHKPVFTEGDGGGNGLLRQQVNRSIGADGGQ